MYIYNQEDPVDDNVPAPAPEDEKEDSDSEASSDN